VPDTTLDRARVAIVTLGCARNEVDSDQLAGMLDGDGYDVVDEAGAADVVVVNTCTFIDPAKQESVDTVLAACDLEDDRARAVVVVGCMAQRYPTELAEAIPEADAIVGFAGYDRLGGLLDDILAGRPHPRVVGAAPAPSRGPTRMLPIVTVGDGVRTSSPPGPDAAELVDAVPVPDVSRVRTPAASRSDAADVADVAAAAPWLAVVPEAAGRDRAIEPRADGLPHDLVPATGPRFPARRHDGRPWSYLKIASGCDRLCTFCSIPSFRGRFRSRPLDELVAEAQWLAGQGTRELVLVSENTTSWGKDLGSVDGHPGGRALQPLLLERLAEVEGIERIRLMYLQPAELEPGLLEAMASIPQIAPYFDLSLQHVTEPLLRRMARSGSPRRFTALVDSIRRLAPDAVFRSNFIVGFPGETDDDVAALEQFLEVARLDWVGLFAYSPQEGTAGATLDGVVPDEVARARLERLASTQERLADAATTRFVGRTLQVLVDRHDTGPPAVNETLGRSYREAPDSDGEIVLHNPDGTQADLEPGRLVDALVVDRVGVDLVAVVH
jgi:MiaB/RimO family radical SAM methylthiotransferase